MIHRPKLGSSHLVSAPPLTSPGAQAAGVPGDSTDPSLGCSMEEAASQRMVGMRAEKGPGARKRILIKVSKHSGGTTGL